MIIMPKMTKNYQLPHRRRRQKKTDYRSRLRLVRSGKTRLVIRRSSSHINVQFVNYSPEGDKVVAAANSQQLKKHGWTSGTGNIPAAYLTGLLAGTKAKEKIKEAVIDMGTHVSTKGSRIYAALKGVLDSGISVAHDASILPNEERIKGQHIASWSEKAAKPSFSKHNPQEITKSFEEAKGKIAKTVSQ